MAVRNVCIQSVAAKIEKDMKKAMDKLTGGIHDAMEDSTAEMNEALNAREAVHVQNTKAFNFHDAMCSNSVNQKGKALMHISGAINTTADQVKQGAITFEDSEVKFLQAAVDSVYKQSKMWLTLPAKAFVFYNG